MKDPNWWVVIGLTLDVAGVFLVGFFEITWVRTNDSVTTGYRWPMQVEDDTQRRLSRSGWALIGLGFLLQIAGQFWG